MKTWDDEPMELRDGEWVLSCPVPLWVGWRGRKAECSCGLRFRDETRYREHWYAEHGS